MNDTTKKLTCAFVYFLLISLAVTNSINHRSPRALTKAQLEILKRCYDLCTLHPICCDEDMTLVHDPGERNSNGPACPHLCPESPVGPWSKRSTSFHKRLFARRRTTSGMGFDDYGWFMRLLGRLHYRR